MFGGQLPEIFCVATSRLCRASAFYVTSDHSMAPVCLLNILASVCILIFLIYINAIVLAAPQAATITSLSPSTARASANGGWANIEYLFALY